MMKMKKSREYNITNKVRSTHNELSTNDYLLTTSQDKSAHNGLIALLPYCPIALRSAFTMAEILLSLTIIGVVAAITLPSLTGNINERTWNTQRKALYSRMSQAISLMPALNGYGKLSEGNDGSGSVVVTEDTATETFVTNGLAKVLKINNICDNSHLSDCGVVTSLQNMMGSKMAMPTTLHELNSAFSNANYSNFTFSAINTKAVAFETQNGESILTFYNPRCLPNNAILLQNYWQYLQPFMCANFVYDLNGKKGPNTVGKDIGVITAMYPNDSVVVAPMPLIRDASIGSNTTFAFSGGAVTESRPSAASVCKLIDDESRIPNADELSSIWYNMNFFYLEAPDVQYWSGTPATQNRMWKINIRIGTRDMVGKTYERSVRCVKR